MKLNKKEFLSKIAGSAGCHANVAQKVLESFQKVMLEVLQAEKEVLLLDMGKIKISHRKERNGINPKTKQVITLPAKNVPKLAASKKLKSFIAGTDGVKVDTFTY